MTAEYESDLSATAKVSFIKSSKDETVTIRLNSADNSLRAIQRTKTGELLANAREGIAACSQLGNPSDIENCIYDSMEEPLMSLEHSKLQLSKQRDRMALRLRNYTCADSTMQSTEPIREEPLIVHHHEYIAKVYFENDHATIFGVDDFITDRECDILMEYGRPRLRRATVAADDGSSIISESRKAQQASYEIFDVENDALGSVYSVCCK